MKKVNVLVILAFIASIGILSSCNKDDDVDPILAEIVYQGYDGSDLTLTEGDTLDVSFMVKQGDAKIESVSADLSTSTTEPLLNETSVDDGDIFDISKVLATADTYVLTITVTDKDGGVTSDEINIVVEESTADFTEYVTKMLFAHQDATTLCALATSTGTTYNTVDANTNAASIDILYGAGASSAQLSCPADANASTSAVYTAHYTDISTWTTINYTEYKYSTITDWSELASSGDIVAAYAGGTTPTDGAGSYPAGRVIDLQTGNIVLFKTAAGKYGAIKVLDVQVGYNDGDYIEIAIKVEN